MIRKRIFKFAAKKFAKKGSLSSAQKLALKKAQKASALARRKSMKQAADLLSSAKVARKYSRKTLKQAAKYTRKAQRFKKGSQSYKNFTAAATERKQTAQYMTNMGKSAQRWAKPHMQGLSKRQVAKVNRMATRKYLTSEAGDFAKRNSGKFLVGAAAGVAVARSYKNDGLISQKITQVQKEAQKAYKKATSRPTAIKRK